MNDAEQFASVEASRVILATVAMRLRAVSRMRPVATDEHADLQTALADLVSLYICDPDSVGNNEEAARIFNRILTLSDAVNLGAHAPPTLH
ncbi:hypothetical protein [Methylobacterium oryzisoli]|uniref:hypothetical protein n=1 Tax=Methylobacterium oryzisoli TaxID=3385502 RepID=UPI003891E757